MNKLADCPPVLAVFHSRMCHLSRFLTFSTAVWILAIIAIFFLVALPPLEDAWAYFFWQRVPCKVTYEKGKLKWFIFNYENQSFKSIREDFWVRNNADASPALSALDLGSFDRTCYVSPKNPQYAVLNLTAHKQWDRGIDSLFISGFVICVATALTFVSHKRRKAQRLAQAP